MNTSFSLRTRWLVNRYHLRPIAFHKFCRLLDSSEGQGFFWEAVRIKNPWLAKMKTKRKSSMMFHPPLLPYTHQTTRPLGVSCNLVYISIDILKHSLVRQNLGFIRWPTRMTNSICNELLPGKTTNNY